MALRNSIMERAFQNASTGELYPYAVKNDSQKLRVSCFFLSVNIAMTVRAKRALYTTQDTLKHHQLFQRAPTAERVQLPTTNTLAGNTERLAYVALRGSTTNQERTSNGEH